MRSTKSSEISRNFSA